MIPLGLRARATIPADSSAYVVAEAGGGFAFLRVIFRGDPEIAREMEKYVTSWTAGVLGGGYRISRGVAVELLAGARTLFFENTTVIQPKLDLGIMMTPQQLKR